MGQLAPVKAFAAVAFVGLGLGGCASMPAITDKSTCMDVEQNNYGLFGSTSRTYNRTCAVNTAAAQLAASADPGLRAVGTRVLAKTNPELAQPAQEVGMELQSQSKRTYVCSASKVETMSDGTRKVILGACVHP